MDYVLCILARRSIVTSKVGSRVAAEACLRLQLLSFAVVCVTNEHAETRLKGSHLRLPRRHIVDNKATLGLASVLVVEEITEEV